jgi:hypothetical protein
MPFVAAMNRRAAHGFSMRNSDSKYGYRKVVQVRFLFWALSHESNYTGCNCFHVSLGLKCTESCTISYKNTSLNFILVRA